MLRKLSFVSLFSAKYSAFEDDFLVDIKEHHRKPPTDVDSKTCVGTGPCSCTFDDGSGTVDITSLGKVGTPAFRNIMSQAVGDAYVYSYNPCFAFTQGTCAGVSVCQNSFDTEFYGLGSQETALFSFDGTDIQVYYNLFTDVLRETFVTYKCDPLAKVPTMVVEGERNLAQFYMTVTTECACADGCVSGTIIIDISLGTSTGTILCILFLVGIFIYLASGMSYNRFRKQATGVEILPNRGFWGSLPGLIKDGCLFLVEKVKSRRSTYDQV